MQALKQIALYKLYAYATQACTFLQKVNMKGSQTMPILHLPLNFNACL